MVYDFTTLTSSTELNWTPCFNQFTCALLKVPLDYEEPGVGTTDIAFIKWSTNATNSSTQDILINPGGPGGSGVDFVMSGISIIQRYVGTAHNIIGFDPRSVNNSGPDISCFPGKEGTQRFYDEDLRRPVDINNTRSLGETFARAGAVGDWCSRVNPRNSSARYVNTVATATDMLTFVEAAAVARGEDKEKAKLSYFGISYGTVLGSTFAALFPDRIERMILDAVVDLEDYYEGKWANNLPDADGAVRTFFKACHEGGNSSCPLWANSPEGVEKRFNAIFSDLTENPIPVSAVLNTNTPTIVTIDDLKAFIGQAAYAPADLFPILANILADLEKRDGDSLKTWSGSAADADADSCSNNTARWRGVDYEPRYYIACNDANNRFNLSTLANYTDYSRQQYKQSQYLGELWAAGTSVICRQLVVNPPESQIFPATFPNINSTSTPILFVGNTLDPVTPLRHAKKMQGRFAGAGLLTQDSPGHAALAARSACTSRYLQDYIRSGSLPPEGTVCKVEQVAFQASGRSTNGTTVTLRKRHTVGL